MFKKFIFSLITLFLFNFSFAQETISKEERCEIAKNNLTTLADDTKPIYKTDGNGLSHELTYSEILEERKINQIIFDNLCIQPVAKPISAVGAAKFINKARLVASQPRDTVEASLKNALLTANFGEVEIILRYVIGLEEFYISQFIDMARVNPTDYAMAEYSKKYKDKVKGGSKSPSSLNSGGNNNNNNNNGNGGATAAATGATAATNKNKGANNNGTNAERKTVPVPEKTPVEFKNANKTETLYYQSNPKHSPGNRGYNPKAGTEPSNSLELFQNSTQLGSNPKTRYAVDSEGYVHRFTGDHNNNYHWNGWTGDASSPLKIKKTSAKGYEKILEEMGANFKLKPKK